MDNNPVSVDTLPPASGTAPSGAQNPSMFEQINDQNNPKPAGVFADMDLASGTQTQTNRYSPEQTKNTASLGALAQQKLNLSNYAPDSDSLKSLVNNNQATLEAGQEKQLRLQIAQASKTDAVDRNLKLQNDIANSKNTYTPLKDALSQGFDLQDAQPDKDALEDHGIAQLQIMAAQDPDQAALLSTVTTQGGGLLGQMRENATKMELFGREIDALSESVKNESWVDKAGDFARDLWPTMNMWNRRGNVPGSGGGVLNPSGSENTEANALWNMPMDQFKAKLPMVMDNFTKVLGGYGHDNSKGLEVAKQYYQGGLNNSDSMGANFWDALDAASVIPVGTFIKIARTPSKIARIVGNRVGSTEIVAGDLAGDIHGTVDPVHSIQQAADSIEESLPSSVAAGATRPDIGIPADVARKLAETRASVAAVQDILPKVARLEPTQLKEAVENAVKESQLRYTDDIVDTKQDMSTMPSSRGAPKIAEAKARLQTEPISKAPSFSDIGSEDFADNSATPEKLDSADLDYKNPVRNQLVVARRFPDGTIKYGKPGDIHVDLISDEEMRSPTAQPSAPQPLPKDLAGAKPRYSYGAKQFGLTFDSDVDRAAYISAQKTPSKRDLDYINYVKQETGMSEQEVRAHGNAIKSRLKLLAKDSEEESLHVPSQLNPDVERKAVGHVGIQESDMGFAKPNGEFLTREEAMAHVRANQPEVNPELAGGGPRDKDKLESTGYQAELNKSNLKRNAEGKLPPHLQEDEEVPSGFRTNPGKLRSEHDLEVARLDAEGAKDAANGVRPAERSSVGYEVGHKTGLFDPEADLDNLSFQNARGDVYTGQVPEESGDIGGSRLPHEVTKDRETGIYSLNLYLGKKNTAGGFLTQKGAEQSAIRKGFGSFAIHQNSDGQYFIKVQHPVTETGIAQPVLTQADFKGVYSQAQYLKTFDNIQPELFNRNRITQTLGKSKTIEEVYKPYVKNITSLSSKSRRLVAKVAVAQEDAQRWLTQPEFEDTFLRGAGRMPTNKETLAFYSARELNDLNWHTFNNEVYIEKARRGLQTVSAGNETTGFSTGKMNGRIIDKPDFDKLRIYDVDEGTHYPQGSATQALNEKIRAGKHRVIDLESPVEQPGGDPIKTVIAHESSSTIELLARDQLGYIPGGSRENRFKWFVKQADSGSFQDGSTYWKRPITHIAARTSKQAQEWADGMERARLAYNDKTLSDADKRLIIDRSPAESYDNFESKIKSGQINPDHPFETLFDRETTKAMSHIGDKDTIWFNSDETPQEQYQISKGKMYYSKKGEHLKDPSGNYAEILDPYVTLNRAMENAAQTNSFSDYNKKVIEEWSRVAAPYLDRNSLRNGSDPYSIFMNGKISPDLIRSKGGQAFANQLEMVRNTHKRFMFGQNPEQRLTYTAARRFGDWAETKGKWGEYLAGKAYDKSDANPIAAVKGYVYDMKVGMFNPTRLWLHTQTAALAWMQHPIYGTRAMAMLPWIEHTLMNGSENLLDMYAKNFSIFHGLEPDDWKDMVRGLKNSGWLNVSGEQLMLDQYMGSIGGSAFKKGVDNIRNYGRIFQNTSERFNRVNAYQIAWQKIRSQFPEVAGTDPEFLTHVNREADILDNNMTTSSQAWWQRGPASVPTQFMAYQTRMLERILPKVFGGSAQVSGRQKLRLAAGGMLLYGAGGVPGGKEFLDWINTQYAAANGGTPMSADTQRKFGRGIYDTALHQMSGGKLDTDISSRVGLGGFTDDIYEKLFNGDMNSVLGVFTGPSGETMGNTWDALSKMALYMKAEQTGSLDAQTWALIGGDAAQQVSTVNNGLKAYWVWKTGQLRDTKTSEPITSEDQMYVITHALGIPSYSEVNRWDLVTHNKDREEHIKDMGKVVAGIRRQFFEASIEHDDKKAAYYSQLASGVLQQFHEDPLFMSQVAMEANKELSRGGFSYDQLKIQSENKTGIKEPE